MAIFRKPGRRSKESGRPTDAPTPEYVAEELAELVEDLEQTPAGPAAPDAPTAFLPLRGPARAVRTVRALRPRRTGGTGEVAHRTRIEHRPAGTGGAVARPGRVDEAGWTVAEYGGERGRRRGAALVANVGRLLNTGGRAAAKGATVGGRALTDQLVQAAPRIPVRNLATLRSQHPDAADAEALADRLVLGAARASAALGAGVGAAAMLPVPLAMPVEIAAETLAVAAVEIKLIAELHEVYGLPATGHVTQRAAAYLSAWANRRGIDRTVLAKPAGFAAMALGSEVRQQVRKRLSRSTLRRLPSLTPLLVGAGVGATVNRRDTRKLAREVRDDLRSRRPLDGSYWTAAAPGAASTPGPRPPAPDALA